MRILAAIALVTVTALCGCGYEPQFQHHGYENREQFNADGTGIIVERLNNDGEEMIAAVIHVQFEPNLDSTKKPVFPPGLLTIEPRSIRSINFAKENGKIVKSKLVIDGKRQSLSNGPWIFFISDRAKFKKIQVAAGQVDEFRDDMANLLLDRLVKKWCGEEID